MPKTKLRKARNVPKGPAPAMLRFSWLLRICGQGLGLPRLDDMSFILPLLFDPDQMETQGKSQDAENQQSHGFVPESGL